MNVEKNSVVSTMQVWNDMYDSSRRSDSNLAPMMPSRLASRDSTPTPPIAMVTRLKSLSNDT